MSIYLYTYRNIHICLHIYVYKNNNQRKILRVGFLKGTYGKYLRVDRVRKGGGKWCNSNFTEGILIMTIKINADILLVYNCTFSL